MNIYNTCVNPSSKFDSVIFLKQCFDNGHKLAQYAFLHENNNLNMTLDNAVQFLQEGTLTKEHLINIVKNGAFIRKEKDLKTVFNYILEISTYLYDQITLNPEYFNLNSTAVRNIEIGTLFHGSCNYSVNESYFLYLMCLS